MLIRRCYYFTAWSSVTDHTSSYGGSFDDTISEVLPDTMRTVRYQLTTCLKSPIVLATL